MWNFITFHLRRRREARLNEKPASSIQTRSKKTQQEKAKARKENKPKREKDEDAAGEDELPEVDQNTKKTLRQRK